MTIEMPKMSRRTALLGAAALGSVSERVTHHAECSVLVVRPASHPAFDESDRDGAAQD